MSIDNLSGSTASLDYPEFRPTLDLNFARSKNLDPRITFTRSSGGTFVGTDGFIKIAGVNQPRFDHNPITGESLGLLIEESRTNSVTNSSNINSTDWTTNRLIFNTNNQVAPDGTLTATKITPDNTTGNHSFRRFGITASGTTSTFSVYVKYNGWRYIAFISNINAGVYGVYDLLNGIALQGSIQNVGNGWYRIISSNYPSNGANTWTISFTDTPTTDYNTQNTWAESIQGRSTVGNGADGIYIWGAQSEAATFASSYIPTGASAVTRAADSASITGTNFSSWFNPNEFSTFVNYSCIPSGWYTPVIAFKASTFNGLMIQGYNGNSWNPYLNGVGNGYFSTTGGGPFNGSQKIAFSTFINNFNFVQNGSVTNVGSREVTGPYTSINSLLIFNDNSTGSQIYNTGTISRLTYWPKRLPNNMLQNLTR